MNRASVPFAGGQWSLCIARSSIGCPPEADGVMELKKKPVKVYDIQEKKVAGTFRSLRICCRFKASKA